MTEAFKYIADNKQKFISDARNIFKISWEDAEDVFQDSCLRLLKYPNDKIQNVDGYIFYMMKCVVIDNYHRKKKLNIVSEELYDTQHPLTYPDSNLYENDIFAQIIRLGSKTETCFNLYLSGYKYHEIAKELHITENTAKSIIHRGRKKLKTRLIRA